MADDLLQPERCARRLATLAVPERLKVVRFLSDGPRSVTDIAAMLGVPAVNVSHHLVVLRNAALIRGSKQGRFVLYSLCPGVLAQTAGPDGASHTLDPGCCRLVIPCETEAGGQQRA